jgi:Caspase domain
MRTLQAALIASAGLALGSPVCAQQVHTVHAVIVGDTRSSLGKGAERSIQQMKDLLALIESTGKDIKDIKTGENKKDIQLHTVVVQGEGFSCTGINRAVANLPVSEGDTVLFYYAGHGRRSSQTGSKFPEFDCERVQNDQRSELALVIDTLVNKKPRLVIGIADACNRPSPVERKALTLPAIPGAGLRRLFLEGYRGKLMLSGVEPGGDAYYSTREDGAVGGFFTDQFLGAVGTVVSEHGASAQWKDVISKAIDKISGGAFGVFQHPQSDDSALVEERGS